MSFLSTINTNNISTNIKIVITSMFLASLALSTSASASINVMTLPNQKPVNTNSQQQNNSNAPTNGFLNLQMVRADGSNSNISNNTESGTTTIINPNLSFNYNNSTSISNPQQVFGFRLSTTNGSNNSISTTSSFGNLSFSNGNNSNSSSSNFTIPTVGKGVVIYNVPVNPNNSYNFGQFVAGQCPDSFNLQMTSMINDFRRQNGVAPVQLDNSLNYVSCQHSNWMRANNNLDHTGVDGTDPFQRCARARTNCNAENIAFHSNKDINWMMEFFRNSPSHRANMLNSEYTKVGIGLSDIYATQLFAN